MTASPRDLRQAAEAGGNANGQERLAFVPPGAADAPKRLVAGAEEVGRMSAPSRPPTALLHGETRERLSRAAKATPDPAPIHVRHSVIGRLTSGPFPWPEACLRSWPATASYRPRERWVARGDAAQRRSRDAA